jgi:hypothetical protein
MMTSRASWPSRFALFLVAAALAAQACAKGDDSVASVYENSSIKNQGGTAGTTGEGGSAGVGGSAGTGGAATGAGNAAQAGKSQGAGAAGAPSCSDGYTLCEGLCAFTSADPNHCGDCGTQCASGVACLQGKCGGQAGAAGGGQAGSGQAGSGTAGSGTAGSGQAGQAGGQAGSGQAGGGGCKPATCQDLGYQCGPTGDGCGQMLDCGACTGADLCGGTTPHQCGGPCNPLASNCTDATTSCYPQTGGSKCSTKGKTPEGSDCTFANDCEPGNVCLTLAMVTRCHRVCDPAGGNPGCTAPATCGKVNDTYGICVAP